MNLQWPLKIIIVKVEGWPREEQHDTQHDTGTSIWQNFREGLFMPGNFIDFECVIVGGFSQPEELENHVRSWTISSKTSRKMDPCGHTPACEGEMEQTFPWRTGYWQPKSPMNMLYLPTHPTLALASAREIYSTCFYMNRKRMKKNVMAWGGSHQEIPRDWDLSRTCSIRFSSQASSSTLKVWSFPVKDTTSPLVWLTTGCETRNDLQDLDIPGQCLLSRFRTSTHRWWNMLEIHPETISFHDFMTQSFWPIPIRYSSINVPRKFVINSLNHIEPHNLCC